MHSFLSLAGLTPSPRDVARVAGLVGPWATASVTVTAVDIVEESER